MNRTRRAGLTWPLPTELDDDVRLENRLDPPPSDLPSDERPHPDWSLIHRELPTNVTLMLWRVLRSVAAKRIGGPLLFGRIWERLGIAAVLAELLKYRAFEFAVERAVFVATLAPAFCLRVGS